MAAIPAGSLWILAGSLAGSLARYTQWDIQLDSGWIVFTNSLGKSPPKVEGHHGKTITASTTIIT